MKEQEQHHTQVGTWREWFRARCSCGWVSRVMDTKAQAETEANDHIVAAVAGS